MQKEIKIDMKLEEFDKIQSKIINHLKNKEVYITEKTNFSIKYKANFFIKRFQPLRRAEHIGLYNLTSKGEFIWKIKEDGIFLEINISIMRIKIFIFLISFLFWRFLYFNAKEIYFLLLIPFILFILLLYIDAKIRVFRLIRTLKRELEK